MPVIEVTNNLAGPSAIMFMSSHPTRDLNIARGVLKLSARPRTRLPARSIDTFFNSLAQDQRERAIGVVLSGTATDGTLGLEAIKAEGGITFAQDGSAQYDSMPRSAVAAGVDFVLAPKNIAKELVRIAKHPYVDMRQKNWLSHLSEGDGADAPIFEGEIPHPAAGTSARQQIGRNGDSGLARRFSCSCATIPAWISRSTNPRRWSGALPGALY